MNIEIIFYQYNGERNRMTKTLENPTSVMCDFNDEYNLINPSLKITGYEVFDYNYCYVPSKKKYYFIDRITERRKGYFDLYLTEDVLQTFHDEILALYGYVNSANNSDLKNSNVPLNYKPKYKKYTFNNVFTYEKYILVTTGNKE